jgi:aminoglycoside phosphotransferase (APT) family kinase protein
LRTPESASDITVDWLELAVARSGGGCRPVSIEVESDCGGPSLLGRIARVRLGYADPGCAPTSVVVKFQAQSSDWEARIYRLLSERQLHSVPKVFGAFEHGTLVMEDLAPAQPGSQLQGCSLRQVKDVLAMLAEVHACFWGNPRVPPIDWEQFASVLRFNMAQCWELFRNRYRRLLANAEADFEWIWRNADVVAAHRLAEPATLFHGDVHPENILFREGVPVLVDWQLAGRGLAANDVSFFVIKSMQVEERRANEERLLRDYFQLLPAWVRKGYSLEELRLDYRACLTRSMMSAVMLAGPRFASRPDQPRLADAVAERVIAAVRDLHPADAVRERAASGCR